VSSTPTNLVVRNNIISVNISSNNGALKHYAIVVPAAIYPWGTGGSNYNDLYVAPTNSQMVLAGLGTAVPYTDVATLPAWQGTFTPNQDLNSISADPVFAGASNLHIVPFSSSPVSNAGTPVAGVTDDIDGDTRTGTPDIGADEYAPVVSGTFVNAGWNMVSNPVTTASDSLRQWGWLRAGLHAGERSRVLGQVQRGSNGGVLGDSANTGYDRRGGGLEHGRHDLYGC
jgi:hypothetical protein